MTYPIDKEKVREVLAYLDRASQEVIYGPAPGKPKGALDPIIEAATAWLAAADGMPEPFTDAPRSFEEKAHNNILATMKTILRIA